MRALAGQLPGRARSEHSRLTIRYKRADLPEPGLYKDRLADSQQLQELASSSWQKTTSTTASGLVYVVIYIIYKNYK